MAFPARRSASRLARPSNFQNMRGPKIIAPHSTGLVQKLQGKARNRTRAYISLKKSSLAKLELPIFNFIKLELEVE